MLKTGSSVTPTGGGSRTGPLLTDIIDEFLEEAERGDALDRYGRPFSRGAVRELRWCLVGHVAEDLGVMGMNDVRRSDVESLLYRLAADGVPGERLRSIAKSVRALYDYAGERGLVRTNPAERVALPDEDEAEQPARHRSRAADRRRRERAERAVRLVLPMATLALAVIALVLIVQWA
jgi:hypothetical protein